MKTVTEQVAKTELTSLIEDAQEMDIIIERDSKPVAVLLSHEEYLCYEELVEEMNMLEYLVSEVENDNDNDEKLSEKIGDKEIKEFLQIDQNQE